MKDETVERRIVEALSRDEMLLGAVMPGQVGAKRDETRAALDRMVAAGVITVTSEGGVGNWYRLAPAS